MKWRVLIDHRAGRSNGDSSSARWGSGTAAGGTSGSGSAQVVIMVARWVTAVTAVPAVSR